MISQGFLYNGYEDGLEWWEVVVLARKTVIAVVLVYFKDPFIQSFAAMFVLTVALYAQLEFKPYKLAILNRVEELGLTTALFTQMLCLSFFWIDHGMDESAAEKAWKTTVVSLLLMWINLDAAMMFATYMWTASKDDAKAFARRIGRKLCGSERWCLPHKVPKKMSNARRGLSTLFRSVSTIRRGAAGRCCAATSRSR